MRIESALHTSREAMTAHGEAISVVGDNISNSSTVGFKEGRAEFSDLLAEGENGRTSSAEPVGGNGVEISRVRQSFQTGTIENTNRELDFAIDGNGFFVVGDAADPSYSRAGNFSINAEGQLVNSEGLTVLGFAPGAQELTPLDMVNLQVAGTPTTTLGVFGNLDASEDIVANVPANPATFRELNSTANFSTNAEVFDSLGQPHSVTLYYFKSDTGEWTTQAYVDAGEVGGEVGVPSLIGEATLTYNATGTIDEANVAAAQIAATPAWSNGANAGAFTIDLSGFSQFAGTTSLTSINQDGEGIGDVVGYEVSNLGVISASLSTGSVVEIGSLPIATFANQDGLAREGASLFGATNLSGDANLAAAGEGGRGGVVGRGLELSNVDLAQSFTELVVLQRGYQASSRILSAAGDILRDTLGLIR